ncbi:MAG: hypothetical protein AAB912_00940 [Patescibacteria group bacterium]
MKSEKPEFRSGVNTVRRDAEGREVCPECGTLNSARCRNCFHSRFGFEDSDSVSPEVATAIEKRKKLSV